MSSSDSYYMEILNNIIIYLYRYGNCLVYVVANIGNLLCAYVLFKRSWRKNVCVFYFLICLLVNSIYTNSSILGVTLNNGFQISLQNSNAILCKIYFYVSFLFPTLSPTVLILASIDRLLISSQNVDTRLYSSKRLAYFSISLNTLFWIVFYFHIFIKTNLQELDTFFVCYFEVSKFYLEFVSYSSLIVNCFVCFLMIILSMFAFKNVRRIRTIPRQQRNQIRRITKKDFQLLRCLFVHDIVYISLSVFANSCNVYDTVTRAQFRTPLEEAINSFLNNFSICIYFTFFGSSFFIFICVSEAFRNEIKRLIYKILGKDLTTIRREENNHEDFVKDNIQLNVVAVVNNTV